MLRCARMPVEAHRLAPQQPSREAKHSRRAIAATRMTTSARTWTWRCTSCRRSPPGWVHVQMWAASAQVGRAHRGRHVTSLPTAADRHGGTRASQHAPQRPGPPAAQDAAARPASRLQPAASGSGQPCRQPELVDDFIRNFLLRAGMDRCGAWPPAQGSLRWPAGGRPGSSSAGGTSMSGPQPLPRTKPAGRWSRSRRSGTSARRRASCRPGPPTCPTSTATMRWVGTGRALCRPALCALALASPGPAAGDGSGGWPARCPPRTDTQALEAEAAHLRQELAAAQQLAAAASGTWEQLRKERDFHRLHHKRVAQVRRSQARQA